VGWACLQVHQHSAPKTNIVPQIPPLKIAKVIALLMQRICPQKNKTKAPPRRDA
jgi:hypothetical protein